MLLNIVRPSVYRRRGEDICSVVWLFKRTMDVGTLLLPQDCSKPVLVSLLVRAMAGHRHRHSTGFLRVGFLGFCMEIRDG